MNGLRSSARQWLAAVWVAMFSGAVLAQAQEASKPFEPVSGQAGKDVVWVPTPQSTVDKMMDMARIGPQDFVMDLGSGDGRNIIAAAKRGARALGVEFNDKMVALSEASAAKEGVADKAKFVQGDMFTADISQATALALFLLPDNLRKLEPKFQALKPGTRIVVNTFGIDGWEPEQTDRAPGECGAWCSVILYIVPAKVAGTWRLPQGELTLDQKVQTLTGSLASNGTKVEIQNGRVRGDQVQFSVNGAQYVGRLNGDELEGVMKGSSQGAWKATKVASR
jgi:SAM-dependent methyltransferase